MAGKSFGGTVKLTGETEYKRALKSINAELKANASELKLVDSAYLTNATSQNKYRAMNDSLSRGMDKQRDKMALIKARLKEASAAYGENDTRVLNLRTEYNKAATELNKMSAALNKNESEMRQEKASVDTTTQSMVKMKSQTSSLGGQMGSMLNPVSGLKGAFKGLALTTAASFSVAGIISWSKSAIDAYKNVEQQTTKLNTIMKERIGANDAEIKSVVNLTTAQSKQGVVGKTAQIQGAQQLGTFVKQTSSLKTLIPAMNNLAVQQNGVNATGKDMQNIGNLMGKVFTGQTGALKRVGISFSDAQNKVLKYGSETEKAAMLAKVITQNVGNMNKAMAKTDAGKIKNAENRIAALKVTLGADLLPLVAKGMGAFAEIVTGVNNMVAVIKQNVPTIAVVMGGATAAMIAFQVAATTAKLAEEGFTIATKLQAVAQAALNAVMAANPIGLIIIGITALVAAITLLWTHSKSFRKAITGIMESIKDKFAAVKAFFSGAFAAIRKGISTVKAAFASFGAFFKNIWNNIISFVKSIPSRIISIFLKLPATMRKIGADLLVGMWHGMTNKVAWVVQQIKGLGKKVVKGLMKVFGMSSPPKHPFADGLETSYGIGQYFTQGIGNGMESSVSDALASAKRVAHKVTESMQIASPNLAFDAGMMSTNMVPNGESQRFIESILNALSDIAGSQMTESAKTIVVNAPMYPNAATAGKAIVELGKTYGRRIG